jgi:hypothetical protein
MQKFKCHSAKANSKHSECHKGAVGGKPIQLPNRGGSLGKISWYRCRNKSNVIEEIKLPSGTVESAGSDFMTLQLQCTHLGEKFKNHNEAMKVTLKVASGHQFHDNGKHPLILLSGNMLIIYVLWL